MLLSVSLRVMSVAKTSFRAQLLSLLSKHLLMKMLLSNRPAQPDSARIRCLSNGFLPIPLWKSRISPTAIISLKKPAMHLRLLLKTVLLFSIRLSTAHLSSQSQTALLLMWKMLLMNSTAMQRKASTL
jgi:hypothetical protein